MWWEEYVTADTHERIWFYPPKFWAATKNMRKEETEELLARVLHMAENAEIDRLRQYPFISVGPLKKSHVA